MIDHLLQVMANDEDLDDYLVSVFIEETFCTNEPIREKPIQTLISKVWIKDDRRRPKKQVIDGVVIKVEPQPRLTINERFEELVRVRQQVGIEFETDDGDIDEEDEDYEDIDEGIDGKALQSLIC